jgi:predicted phage tail component-like protein
MYVKYAGIILSDLFQVRTVNTSAIPNRKNISIDIPSRHGELYNGFKYGTREIEITFIVRPDNSYEYSQYVTDIANALDVDAPSRLYLGDELSYYYSVPDGKVEIDEISVGVGEGKVNFTCYDPMIYSNEYKLFEGTNLITAKNDGTTDAYPIIKTNFSKDAHFVQVTNADTGKAVLIGEWTNADKNSQANKTLHLQDPCEVTTSWLSAGNVVDTDRLVEGGVTINSGGYGIKASNFGTTTDQKWHGPAVRRNLGTNVQDFEVVATFEHDSKGKNVSNNLNTPSNSQYQTTANLNIRSGRGTSNKVLTTMPSGTKITVTDIASGWGKVTYKNITGYCSMQYLKLVAAVNSTHRTTANLNLRSGRGTGYKIILTIPNGTSINVSEISGGWGKTTYKGYTGYVSTQYLTALTQTASATVFNGEDTADNKLGVIELYGFDSNGQKLFKMMLTDANEWYEYTHPQVQIGNNIVLKDDGTVPKPLTKKEKNDKGEEVTVNDLSGKYGKWNEFYGNIKVRRKTINGKHQWYCEVNKIKDGKVVTTIHTANLVSDSYPKGSLNNVVLYMGAFKDKSPVEMTLTHLSINQLNTVDSTVNQKIFKNGDELEIDCSTNMVYLNDEPFMQHVDIGSQFFELGSGDTNIKIHSDDAEIFSTVTLTERWL